MCVITYAPSYNFAGGGGASLGNAISTVDWMGHRNSQMYCHYFSKIKVDFSEIKVDFSEIKVYFPI